MSSINYQMKTFGCKVNTYDSGLLQGKLQTAGFVNSENSEAEFYILNSCAVTAEATKEVMREARRLKKQFPKSKIVLTGCSAQVDGALLDVSPDVDLIVANSHKNQLQDILKDIAQGRLAQKVYRSNIFKLEDLGAGGGEESQHSRSFLKIQDGCNSFCSFCVIPFARGKSRSLTVPMILAQLKKMEAQGIKEAVLSGVHIGDYLDDETFGGPFALDDLVEQVLAHTQTMRFRLGSLEPIELTEKLMMLFKNPRLCPQFHMSVQSFSTPVLRDMRRHYTAEQVKEALVWIARDLPHAFVGLDVIAGFPSESEELFLETYNNLKNAPWTRIHVFPYSERQGTRATTLTSTVPWSERKKRAQILRELSRERYDQRALEQLGQEKSVLFLKGKNQLQGLSEDYWDIVLPQEISDVRPGQLYKVKIQGYERAQKNRMNGFLVGEVLV